MHSALDEKVSSINFLLADHYDYFTYTDLKIIQPKYLKDVLIRINSTSSKTVYTLYLTKT